MSHSKWMPFDLVLKMSSCYSVYLGNLEYLAWDQMAFVGFPFLLENGDLREFVSCERVRGVTSIGVVSARCSTGANFFAKFF